MGRRWAISAFVRWSATAPSTSDSRSEITAASSAMAPSSRAIGGPPPGFGGFPWWLGGGPVVTTDVPTAPEADGGPMFAPQVSIALAELRVQDLRDHAASTTPPPRAIRS